MDDQNQNVIELGMVSSKYISDIVHNEPTDLISIWRATRCKNGKFTEDDGAAGLEQTLQRRLDELPEEERDDAEKREKIFLDVICSDGHGRLICGGTTSSTSSQTSASLIHDYEAKIARLKEVIVERDQRDDDRDRRDEERDLRHQEQIAELRSQLQVTLQSTVDSEARIIRMLQSAGFSTILSSIPSPRQSSGHGSTSRNQTT